MYCTPSKGQTRPLDLMGTYQFARCANVDRLAVFPTRPKSKIVHSAVGNFVVADLGFNNEVPQPDAFTAVKRVRMGAGRRGWRQRAAILGGFREYLKSIQSYPTFRGHVCRGLDFATFTVKHDNRLDKSTPTRPVVAPPFTTVGSDMRHDTHDTNTRGSTEEEVRWG